MPTPTPTPRARAAGRRQLTQSSIEAERPAPLPAFFVPARLSLPTQAPRTPGASFCRHPRKTDKKPPRRERAGAG